MAIGKKVTILLIIISILLVIAILTLNQKPDSTFSYTESAKSFSDSNYTIFFIKDARGPQGDGSILDVYSIYSDATSEKIANSAVKNWPDNAYKYGVGESMGSYYGDTGSPDGSKKIVFEHPFAGWFKFFFPPTVYVEEDGQKKILPQGVLGELEWLPDNKRIVFANGDKIGIISVESQQYSYLTDGVGWIVTESNE